ncbi:tyrosine recombinase XerC [Oceanobacillus sp. FSL H7-0719]|uniref:site-specific integrase n=1 Tax=Oceanobacillus sp. FSL H7-0719 TaxID=2954507 RepID=UPI00324E19FC
MAKRKGHARPRGNGRWQLEVDLGKKLYGKGRNRKYKTITAKSEKEANIELAKFIADVFDEGYVDLEDVGFIAFVENVWIPKGAKPRLAETTFEAFMEYLDSRIKPAFQYFKLSEVQPIHIIDFLDNLSEPGMKLTKYKDPEKGKDKKLATSTIHYYYRILKHIFDFAVEVHAIKKSPLDGVQKPSVDYEEVEPYAIDEAIAVYNALDKELLHWSIAFKLAIIGGLRRSELFGLDLMKHIDLKNKVLYVRDALTYTKRDGYSIHEIKKGSRRAKRRDIALPDDLIEPIARLMTRRQKEREQLKKEELWKEGKHFLLLCHENGKPFNPDSMRNWWERFLKRHNFRYLNIHGLRHTMVTLLIELKIPLAQISRRAGHSGIGITNDVYGHRVQSIDELATARLTEILKPKKQIDTTKNNEKQADAVNMSADDTKNEESAIS